MGPSDRRRGVGGEERGGEVAGMGGVKARWESEIEGGREGLEEKTESRYGRGGRGGRGGRQERRSTRMRVREQ